MNVDLASALDARSNEGTRGERAEGEHDGAFPTLLRSSLDRSEAGRGREAEAGERSRADAGRGERSEGERAAEARADAASDRASERVDRDEARSEQARSEDELRDGAGDGDPGEGRPEAEAEARTEREAMEEEAASQGAALGAAGGSVASGLVVAAEAEQAVEGRLTALDAEADVDPETEGGRKASAPAVDAIAAGDGAVSDAERGEAELGEAEASAARAALEAAAVSSEEGGARVGEDAATATTTVSASAPEAPREARVAPETGDAAIAAPVAERDVEIAGAGTAAEDRGDAPRDSGEEARDPGLAREPAGEQVEVDRAAEGALSSGVDPNLRQVIANGEQATLAADEVALAGAAGVASPVAGQAVETTTSATPGAPTPVAASEAISVQTEWLATRGGGTARLVLHPPELGEMAIRVTLRGNTVDVVMVAQEAVAQAVAEEQGDRLAQALQARDLRMDQFEVRRGHPEGFSEGGFAGSGADRDDRAGDERGGAEEGETRRDLLGRRRGGAEHAPQIVSLAPERGVDLRI